MSAADMKKNILLISVESPEISIAEIRDGRLFDLHIERGGRVLNDIFKGRVENVVPGMDAAFVNIGLTRNALIYAGDIDVSITKAAISKSQTSTISQLIKSGEEVLVQHLIARRLCRKAQASPTRWLISNDNKAGGVLSALRAHKNELPPRSEQKCGISRPILCELQKGLDLGSSPDQFVKLADNTQSPYKADRWRHSLLRCAKDAERNLEPSAQLSYIR